MSWTQKQFPFLHPLWRTLCGHAMSRWIYIGKAGRGKCTLLFAASSTIGYQYFLGKTTLWDGILVKFVFVVMIKQFLPQSWIKFLKEINVSKDCYISHTPNRDFIMLITNKSKYDHNFISEISQYNCHIRNNFHINIIVTSETIFTSITQVN